MILALVALAAARGIIVSDMQLTIAQAKAAVRLEAGMIRYGMCANLHDLGDLPREADVLIHTYHDASGSPETAAIKFAAIMYLGDIMQGAGSKERMCSPVLKDRSQAVATIQADWTALRASLSVDTSHTQAPLVTRVPRYVIDASGYCIWPRNFSQVSAASRSRVERFWNGTVNAHRLAQRHIGQDKGAELRRNNVDQRSGLSDEQKHLRNSIAANAWEKIRQDAATYSRQFDAFISSLPQDDRQPAERALGIVIKIPPGPGCPRGFQDDPIKIPG